VTKRHHETVLIHNEKGGEVDIGDGLPFNHIYGDTLGEPPADTGPFHVRVGLDAALYFI
jgi:hypothetical protein